MCIRGAPSFSAVTLVFLQHYFALWVKLLSATSLLQSSAAGCMLASSTGRKGCLLSWHLDWYSHWTLQSFHESSPRPFLASYVLCDSRWSTQTEIIGHKSFSGRWCWQSRRWHGGVQPYSVVMEADEGKEGLWCKPRECCEIAVFLKLSRSMSL